MVVLLLLIVGGYFLWSYFLRSPAASDTSGTQTTDVVTPAPTPVPIPAPTPNKSATPVGPATAESTPTPPPVPVVQTPAKNEPIVPENQATKTAPPPAGPSSAPEVANRITQARQFIEQKQLVKAREMLNQALQGKIVAADAAAVRQEIGQINQSLIFSPLIEQGDPIAEAYVIQPGDLLTKIAKKHAIPWEFLAKVNSVNPSRIQIGKRLKVIKGPFHVTVHKNEFRLDVYAGGNEDAGGNFIRSFRVGIGEFDSTPLGKFIVRKGGKLANPDWTNPRTGSKYRSDDPKNPLGEYWIGLRGTEEKTKIMSGYGIHGTIEPQTIGTQASMGCVRLLPEDIALLFSMLEEEQSTVTIAP